MKYIYLLLLPTFLIFFGNNVTAQNFKAYKDSVFVSGVNTNSDIISYNKVYNFKSGAELAWKITPDIPSGWQTAVCDNNTCYPPGTDSATFLTIAVGDSSPFQVYVQPNGISGEGKVHVYVYDKKGNYNDGIEFTHYIKSYPVGLLESSLPKFNMYPNPVKDYLNIKFSSKGKHEIEVYNILGRQLMNRTINNSDYMKINLSAYQNGMYVIMYRDEKGKVITKTISKD